MRIRLKATGATMTDVLDAMDAAHADLKRRDPNLVLLFAVGAEYRAIGAEYRAIGADADRVAALTGLTLDQDGDGTATVRVPRDAVEATLAAIVMAGGRAAVLEQVRPSSLDVSQGRVTGERDGMIVIPGTPLEPPEVVPAPKRTRRKAGKRPHGVQETSGSSHDLSVIDRTSEVIGCPSEPPRSIPGPAWQGTLFGD